MTGSVIGATQFTGERANGDRLSIVFRVHSPMQISQNEWHCTVTLEGLEDHLGPVAGEDAVQALCLALALAASLLRSFVTDGGRLLFADSNSEVPLDAYFGPFVPAGDFRLPNGEL